MFNPLKWADDALIDGLYQPLADWIVDRTLRSNFTVARLCVYVAALLFIYLTVIDNSTKVDVSMTLFALIGMSWWLVPARNEEKRTAKFVRSRCLNRLRYTLRWYREFLLVALLPFMVVGLFQMASERVSLTVGIPDLLAGVLWLSSLYFAACTPKPPKPKVQEEKVPAHLVPQTG